jgi:hypothetical protein
MLKMQKMTLKMSGISQKLLDTISLGVLLLVGTIGLITLGLMGIMTH